MAHPLAAGKAELVQFLQGGALVQIAPGDEIAQEGGMRLEHDEPVSALLVLWPVM